jgi:hypothetical protein
MQTAIRTITITLSKEEINQKARHLAEAISEKASLIEAKKAALSDYKAMIEQKEALIRTLSVEITSGSLTEDVQCIIHKDYEAGMKQFIHQGEVVASEPLSAEDRQLSMI